MSLKNIQKTKGQVLLFDSLLSRWIVPDEEVLFTLSPERIRIFRCERLFPKMSQPLYGWPCYVTGFYPCTWFHQWLDPTCCKRWTSFPSGPFDPAGRDLEILQAISNPPLKISGFTKKMLRQHLSGKSFAIRLSEKHLSAKISRQLRMLQTHGLLRKLPRQNKY